MTASNVRKQLTGLAAVIDVWWEQVREDWQPQIVLTPMWQSWVEAHLLPLIYWEQQVPRTRHRGRKAIMIETLKAVQTAFETHPLTAKLSPEVLAGWKAWAVEHVKTFQRASSAAEGRNGYLSQMHHNHRGLPKRRYKVALVAWAMDKFKRFRGHKTRAAMWLRSVARREPKLFVHWQYQGWMTRAV